MTISRDDDTTLGALLSRGGVTAIAARLALRNGHRAGLTSDGNFRLERQCDARALGLQKEVASSVAQQLQAAACGVGDANGCTRYAEAVVAFGQAGVDRARDGEARRIV